MPSCSRIARRCGDRDASSNGAAGGASATLQRSVRIVRRRLGHTLWISRPTAGTAVGLCAASPSRRLARDPDLFVRPLARPLGRDVRVVRVCLRTLGRVQLDEALDLEAVLVEQVDPPAVAEMELDLLRVAPLDAAQVALRAQQMFGRAVEIHPE